VADLTSYQLAVLRQCQDPPGARFPSTDAEVLALDHLAVLGLVRVLSYHPRNRGPWANKTCWQRTPAGKEVANG
jgi:hypothetical protein